MRVFAVILLVLVSCSSKKVEFKDMDEMNAYINNPENGFIVSDGSSDLLFETKLTPAFKDEKKPRFTIQMRISRKDQGSVLEYNDASPDEVLSREGYLSFELLKDISIKINGKSYPALFHHYERNYGLKPSIDILFEFEHIEPKSEVVLSYRDQIFGQGLVKLKFSKELFKKCYVAKK